MKARGLPPKEDPTRFHCHRCGMSFLYECPFKRAARAERLVCSECHIAFGATTSHGRRSVNPVVCWLIREGGARALKGVRKLA